MNSAPPTIEITISPAGECAVQTRGFVGPGCRDASRFVEQALGERTTEQLTAEYYQPLTGRESAGQHA